MQWSTLIPLFWAACGGASDECPQRRSLVLLRAYSVLARCADESQENSSLLLPYRSLSCEWNDNVSWNVYDIVLPNIFITIECL